MHGPKSLGDPYDYPRVPFVDSVAPEIPSALKRRKWRRARNRALGLWKQAGFIFDQVRPIQTPVYDPNSPLKPRWVWDNPEHSTGHIEGDEEAFMKSLLVPGAMHLVPMHENWVYGTVTGVGWMFETGAFAAFNVDKMFDDLKYLVPHEMGHALGLGHAREIYGGTSDSVMYMSEKGYRGSGVTPNEHDLDSLRTYHAD